jgi:hypothetical protein
MQDRFCERNGQVEIQVARAKLPGCVVEPARAGSAEKRFAGGILGSGLKIAHF